MFEVEQYKHEALPWGNGIGELFCSRDVHRELGTAVISEHGYTWFIAMTRGKLAGFAAVEEKGTKAIFRHAYVLPSYRGQGVYTLLLNAREGFVQNNLDLMLMETTAAPDSYQKLKSADWSDHRQRGKYMVMHKEVRRG